MAKPQLMELTRKSESFTTFEMKLTKTPNIKNVHGSDARNNHTFTDIPRIEFDHAYRAGEMPEMPLLPIYPLNERQQLGIALTSSNDTNVVVSGKAAFY